MRLTLGSHSYDLTTRALVLGVPGDPAALVAEGADLVELDERRRPAHVPRCAVAADETGVWRALSAGVSLVRLPAPSTAALELCAVAGAAVVVPVGAEADAAAAGIPPDRILAEPLLVDVVGDPCPVAAVAVGVLRGGRIVRATDVRGARRVCDVLAAVLEAG